jgi:hypothetical protein
MRSSQGSEVITLLIVDLALAFDLGPKKYALLFEELISDIVVWKKLSLKIER